MLKGFEPLQLRQTHIGESEVYILVVVYMVTALDYHMVSSSIKSLQCHAINIYFSFGTPYYLVNLLY